MAKVRGPLLSQKASGSVGPCLTFSQRNSGQQVRYQRKQKLIISTWGQADQKSLYRVIYARWVAFSNSEKEAYDNEAKAKGLAMSGWNYFLKLAVSNPLEYLGLCGYWSMNRADFGTVLDLSKNNNIGTLKPDWPADAPKYVESKNKKMLKALSFDGVNDYVDCGNEPSLDITKAITVAAWVNTSLPTKYKNIVAKQDYTPYSLRHENGRDFFFDVSPSGGRVSPGDGKSAAAYANLWTHLVGTYDSNTGKAILYLNGNLWDEKTTSGTLPSQPTYKLFIGKQADKEYFLGLIGEVRIYNRILLSEEIKEYYFRKHRRFAKI